ncbi:hypothetical protein BDB00DRAFT_870669 [Zychaea mexicana]|uniref:uncharacterized protein n=1 Tax=Zychaea mexicana TaxID=64656 RepID=UPI0022FDDE5C|nr:uncharacterized protein BDB00DRAFT_870669 [Zychaea mexicana]KAI9495222.1 hypothetical protein BDB00DRAFT_870669 [Zychaea mexicana]
MGKVFSIELSSYKKTESSSIDEDGNNKLSSSPAPATVNNGTSARHKINDPSEEPGVASMGSITQRWDKAAASPVSDQNTDEFIKARPAKKKKKSTNQGRTTTESQNVKNIASTISGVYSKFNGCSGSCFSSNIEGGKDDYGTPPNKISTAINSSSVASSGTFHRPTLANKVVTGISELDTLCIFFCGADNAPSNVESRQLRPPKRHSCGVHGSEKSADNSVEFFLIHDGWILGSQGQQWPKVLNQTVLLHPEDLVSTSWNNGRSYFKEYLALIQKMQGTYIIEGLKAAGFTNVSPKMVELPVDLRPRRSSIRTTGLKYANHISDMITS